MRNHNLINTRKSKGIIQKQMAENCGMEQTTYSKKELGVSIIREEEWIRFAKVLNVSPDQIKNELPHGKDQILISKKYYNQIIQGIQDLKKENESLKQQLK
jgi:transcriptional regulator with XRE-family HTH domain